MTYQGLLTALVTPFVGGRVHEATLRSLIQRQIDGGVQGLVPCGTTGEAPTLKIDEHVDVVRWTVEEAGGAVPVLAGIGSNFTQQAIETAQAVQAVGAQGVLATVPYYNKPSQEGLFQHFCAIARSISIEVCLYDVPGRTACHLQPETVERLAEIPNITAIKDATADLAFATEVLRRCGERITLLSGDDFTAFPFIAVGGGGTISVASNVAPRQMRALIDAAREGDLISARALNQRLFPLFQALFLESNPMPVKAAMAAMGLIDDELRLPMVPMAKAHTPRLLAALKTLELLSR